MDHLDHLGWVAQQSFRMGEVEFGIRTTSEAFAAWLGEVLGAYRIAADTRPEFSIVIGDGGAGRGERKFHILYRGTITLTRTFHLPTLVRMLQSELDGFFVHDRDDAIYTDTTLVAANGIRAMVPSSLVFYVGSLGRRVDRAGLRLPVDTVSAIDPETGLLVPARHAIDVSPEAIEALAATSPTNGDRADRFTLDRPTAADAVCSIAEAEEPWRLVTPGVAVYRMADHVLNLPKLGSRALEGLGRLVERGRPVELDAAGPKDMLAALASLARQAR
jgi:hypothetical protein